MNFFTIINQKIHDYLGDDLVTKKKIIIIDGENMIDYYSYEYNHSSRWTRGRCSDNTFTYNIITKYIESMSDNFKDNLIFLILKQEISCCILLNDHIKKEKQTKYFNILSVRNSDVICKFLINDRFFELFDLESFRQYFSNTFPDERRQTYNPHLFCKIESNDSRHSYRKKHTNHFIKGFDDFIGQLILCVSAHRLIANSVDNDNICEIVYLSGDSFERYKSFLYNEHKMKVFDNVIIRDEYVNKIIYGSFAKITIHLFDVNYNNIPMYINYDVKIMDFMTIFDIYYTNNRIAGIDMCKYDIYVDDMRISSNNCINNVTLNIHSIDLHKFCMDNNSWMKPFRDYTILHTTKLLKPRIDIINELSLGNVDIFIIQYVVNNYQKLYNLYGDIFSSYNKSHIAEMNKNNMIELLNETNDIMIVDSIETTVMNIDL